MEVLVHNNRLGIFEAEKLFDKLCFTTVIKIESLSLDNLIVSYSGYCDSVNSKIYSYFQKYDVFGTFGGQSCVVIERPIYTENFGIRLVCKTYKWNITKGFVPIRYIPQFMGISKFKQQYWNSLSRKIYNYLNEPNNS